VKKPDIPLLQDKKREIDERPTDYREYSREPFSLIKPLLKQAII
jgi:hypothetical protein